jgi:acetyl-CoA C-acetyltransferase/acetyl-CoA acyltransferase
MLDIAILDGARTPFVKAFGALAKVPAHVLGQHAAVAALNRANVRGEQVDQTIFGNVSTPAEASNIARVIAVLAGVPRDRVAHTVGRNCASGLEAITEAAQLIALGEAKVVLAGGTESMSRVPLLYNEEAVEQFTRLNKSKGWWSRLKAMLGFRPRHFKPIVALQLGLTDPLSGLIMGDTAEVLVKDFGLSREGQDAYALLSHQRATAAQKAGIFAEEIAPLPADVAGQPITEDIGPRVNQTLEALAKLKPVFQKDGTVTAGNSSAITDGAAAVVLMPGEMARAEGRRPLGYLRAYSWAALDPARMGLGPYYATAKLLDKVNMKLADIDRIELNEAFAAVVLANEKVFPSAEYAREHLGGHQPLGDLDREKMNVHGGAIALGHPVGATGARLVLTLLKELRRKNLRWGLATLCIGGGQGGAALVEAA